MEKPRPISRLYSKSQGLDIRRLTVPPEQTKKRSVLSRLLEKVINPEAFTCVRLSRKRKKRAARAPSKPLTPPTLPFQALEPHP